MQYSTHLFKLKFVNILYIFIRIEDDELVEVMGIRFRDFAQSDQANLTIVDGGVGESFVTVKVVAPAGRSIMRVIGFYYKRIDYGTHIVKNYFEAKVEIEST